MRKLRLSPWFVKTLYKFLIDAEASGASSQIDNYVMQYAFIVSKIIGKMFDNAKILEVGCTQRFNFLPAVLCSAGYSVTGLDIRDFNYIHPKFKFVNCDIRKTKFLEESFDLIYAVSSISHVGVSGRYGVVDNDPNGDFKAIESVRKILRINGRLLITFPFADKYTISTLGRVYDMNRIVSLFQSFVINEMQLCNQTDGTILDKLNYDKANLIMLDLIKK